MNSVIGLDIGYGYTKAVSNTGIATLPSVIGPAVTIKYHGDLAGNGRGLTLETDGKAWFVGQQARLQSPFTISPRPSNGIRKWFACWRSQRCTRSMPPATLYAWSPACRSRVWGP